VSVLSGWSGHAVLAGLWLGYFAVHSLLAARWMKAAVVRRAPDWGRRGYRLAYNLLAVVLLVPPLALMTALSGPPVIDWRGPAWWLAQLAAAAAVAGFVHSLRGYDTGHFLGMRHWREGGITDGGAEPWEPLRLAGYHRFVRHPWYFFGLVILWTRDMDTARLVSATAATLYLVAGSRLEEARLRTAYGAAYDTYRRRVPALVPLPGKYLTPGEAQALAREANQQGASS
jgi:protein-S-isoprenylcysteine O-methyltransferase Ste14